MQFNWVVKMACCRLVAMNWPWTNGQQQIKRIKEEAACESLSHVKADSQDILCCMILSECVYQVHFHSTLHIYIQGICVYILVIECEFE